MGQQHQNEQSRCTPSKQQAPWLRRASNVLVEALENSFYRLGLAVGLYPWVFIIGCLAMVAVCGAGAYFFKQENREEKLWVPYGSRALKDKMWVDNAFPSKMRIEMMIATADNVLDPRVIKAMFEVDKAVKTIYKRDAYDWHSICVRLSNSCWSNSLLELWSFKGSVIHSLTKADILERVNQVVRSPVYHTKFNVSKVLGKVKKNRQGEIIAAEAAMMTYFLKDNSIIISGEEVDQDALDWEAQFIEIGKRGHRGLQDLFVYAERSFADEAKGTIFGDVKLLSIGYIIIITFTAVVLGKFNAVEQRIYVSLCGVMCTGFAFIVSVGVCCYCGVLYGPAHSILPFLLLGIGVDDMFVIVQAWENLDHKVANSHTHEKIGLTLRHAGMSITITSLTDIAAFAIGATTVIPALRSFCIYASVGVLATFICQITFFVACLTLNQRRAKGHRDACCPCIFYKKYNPNDCSQRSLVQTFFEKYYGPILVKTPVKVLVIIITLAVLGVNIYGAVKLETEFDPAWFFPGNSYASKYNKAVKQYFPQDGVLTNIYIGGIDYYRHFGDLERFHWKVSKNKYVSKDTTVSWFHSFRVWLHSTSNPAVTPLINAKDKMPTSRDNFYSLLKIYIHGDMNSGGVRFASDVLFSNSTPETIYASRMTLKHRSFSNAREEILAMDSLRDDADSMGFEAPFFPYTKVYLIFEGNKVIQTELYRNIGMAFGSVFIMTLVLIADIWTCVLVSTCVIMTLVDVGGLMYFWGVTIEMMSSVTLILAIGLPVDYAAHIGHNFMTEAGPKDVRAIQTATHMAPAVFYGGFSTFLAFVLLAGSASYVFSTFFKVFLGVVVFGLWHGLVYLIVVLSCVGPRPYLSVEQKKSDTSREANGSNHLPRDPSTSGMSTLPMLNHQCNNHV